MGITDANGNLIAQYTYDSWGKLVKIIDPTIDITADPNANDVASNMAHIGNINPIRYRGYYYDHETRLYYLNARYYDPETGRFISSDDNLSDLNLFKYCANNPANFFDPSGKIVYLIHGTNSDIKTWWNENDETFKNHIEGIFNEEIERFEWNGENNDEARQNAANRLYGDIVKHSETNSSDPIRLVAHSHGGNVAILAANLLSQGDNPISVATLITIATPVREDYQLTTPAGQHLQVYNTRDWVQTGGGNDGNLIKCGISGALYSSAGRTFKNANNIEVAVKGFHPMDHHSSMHANSYIWKEYIEPNIIK